MHDGHDEELLQLAFEVAGLDLWENNLHTGQVVKTATKIFRELGYGDAEIPAVSQDWIALLHPDDRQRTRDALQEVLDGRVAEYRCEFRVRTKSGDWIWYANYGRVMDADSARPGERFVGVTINIDGRKRREAELEHINDRLEKQNVLLQSLNDSLRELAATDSLTGLANRRSLMELGDKECRRAQRFRHPLSLLMVDIDSFKSINDHWGHQVGDRVICAAAAACRQHSRQGVDTVARLGGEEFVLLLPETPGTSAASFADALRVFLSAQQVFGEQGDLVEFTVSIGVASFRSGLTIEQLLNHADKALYRAKKKGRNQVQRFEHMLG